MSEANETQLHSLGMDWKSEKLYSLLWGKILQSLSKLSAVFFTEIQVTTVIYCFTDVMYQLTVLSRYCTTQNWRISGSWTIDG